MKNQQMIE